jgi:hypothetical protein
VNTYYEPVHVALALRGLAAYLDRLPHPAAAQPVEKFVAPARCTRPATPKRVREYRYFRMPTLTQSIPRPTLVTGAADPVWDGQFTTKFSRKPEADAPPVAPKGHQPVLDRFLDRAAEIEFLARTQHLELATTRAEMAANGIPSFSLSSSTEEDHEAANIAESHLRIVPLDPDPAYISTMSRRIEWERFMFACGPVHRVRFATTKDNVLGIVYDGPSKDPDFILRMKRSLKSATLERIGRLPTVEEAQNAEAFLAYYPTPFFAVASDTEIDTYHASRHGWETNEDPDPLRVEFHAEDLRGKNNRNYAGPHGSLGLDDDEDDDDFANDE